jgi:hypothetical protein
VPQRPNAPTSVVHVSPVGVRSGGAEPAVDSERAAVYAAEAAALDGTDLEDVVGIDRVGAVVGSIVAGEWWPGPVVEVRAARSDARSSSARCGASSTIVRIAASQATLATGLHELAHALAGVEAGHGARFRAALLDVVAVATNLDSTDRRRRLHVDQLAAAFRAAGLAVGVRSWPAPPAEITGAIAL